MTLACGWCLAFNDECCGRPACPGASWCAPGIHERKEHDMTDPRENPLVRVIRKGWEQLDAEVDAIVAASAEPGVKENPSLWNELEQLKARARGKAEILAYIMNVAYPAAWKGATADDVSREAGRRAAHRAKNASYGTVGVEWNTNVLTASRDELTVLDDKRGVLG